MGPTAVQPAEQEPGEASKHQHRKEKDVLPLEYPTHNLTVDCCKDVLAPCQQRESVNVLIYWLICLITLIWSSMMQIVFVLPP
jgi:hypothetical protein